VIKNVLKGKKILITGASSGIGKACALALAEYGVHLLLVARRIRRLQQLQQEIIQKHHIDVAIYETDISNRSQVTALADDLRAKKITPDILINNAGLASGLSKIQDGNFDDWDKMIDTNLKGLLAITRLLLPHMIERNTGHIINIGSIAGHQVYPNGNVYNATKFAVRALTEAMNIDLVDTNIRVSSIDPGAVETEFSQVRFHGDKERAAKVYEGYIPLSAEDIADAVTYVLTRPPHVNIREMLVLPTAQRSATVIGRTHTK